MKPKRWIPTRGDTAAGSIALSVPFLMPMLMGADGQQMASIEWYHVAIATVATAFGTTMAKRISAAVGSGCRALYRIWKSDNNPDNDTAAEVVKAFGDGFDPEGSGNAPISPPPVNKRPE